MATWAACWPAIRAHPTNPTQPTASLTAATLRARPPTRQQPSWRTATMRLWPTPTRAARPSKVAAPAHPPLLQATVWRCLQAPRARSSPSCPRTTSGSPKPAARKTSQPPGTSRPRRPRARPPRHRSSSAPPPSVPPARSCAWAPPSPAWWACTRMANPLPASARVTAWTSPTAARPPTPLPKPTSARRWSTAKKSATPAPAKKPGPTAPR